MMVFVDKPRSQVQLIYAMASEWCVGGGEGKLPGKSWVVVDRHHAYMRTRGISEEEGRKESWLLWWRWEKRIEEIRVYLCT